MYFEDCLSLQTNYPLIYQSFLQGEFVVKLSQRKASAVPMDQALESKYNKPAKSSSGIIGITRKKEAVCKWNLVKHEKSNYTSLLRDISGISHEDEYSLHHEFSQKRTETDKKCVKQVTSYMAERGNPFDVKEGLIKNLATGATLDDESSRFYLNCLANGKEAYENFKEERLEKKSKKLFDTIPKTRSTRQTAKKSKTPDVKKETIDFLCTIDYARLRQFNVEELLSYEIGSTSFYLTKDGSLRKSPKSELAREIKKLLDAECSESVPAANLKSMIVIDFMAYARKVPTKKMKLQTYEDFVKVLWKTFSTLSNNCVRTDIIFDLYLQQSIKQDERIRRSKSDPIETKIGSIKQQLPVEMDRFWASSDNKMRFQQAFIKWITSHCQFDVPVFLGGASAADITSCVQLYGGEVTNVPSLRNDHEEADDRMMYHANQSIKEECFEKVIIASSDTDVFVCALYHFNRWIYSGLKELWVVSGKSGTTMAFPIHQLALKLESDVIDILPAVHALTG